MAQTWSQQPLRWGRDVLSSERRLCASDEDREGCTGLQCCPKGKEMSSWQIAKESNATIYQLLEEKQVEWLLKTFKPFDYKYMGFWSLSPSIGSLGLPAFHWYVSWLFCYVPWKIKCREIQYASSPWGIHLLTNSYSVKNYNHIGRHENDVSNFFLLHSAYLQCLHCTSC